MTPKNSISLIVSTYNKPEFLELTLRSALSQSRLPDEIIVADDGSGPATADLVAQLAKESPVPLIHVWHEDEGFRLAAIRNKAITKASADYIIQIDGDIILHPDFVADHERFARRGSFVTGSRVLLGPEITKRIVGSNDFRLQVVAKQLPKPLNGRRIPFLAPIFQNMRSSDGAYVRGCHMAFWRADLLRVNGYNEDIKGWGREDSEISWRLINSGLRKRFIKFSAIEYHLYHPENSRAADSRNIEIMNRAKSEGITRIPNGIEKLG